MQTVTAAEKVRLKPIDTWAQSKVICNQTAKGPESTSGSFF